MNVSLLHTYVCIGTYVCMYVRMCVCVYVYCPQWSLVSFGRHPHSTHSAAMHTALVTDLNGLSCPCAAQV